MFRFNFPLNKKLRLLNLDFLAYSKKSLNRKNLLSCDFPLQTFKKVACLINVLPNAFRSSRKLSKIDEINLTSNPWTFNTLNSFQMSLSLRDLLTKAAICS